MTTNIQNTNYLSNFTFSCVNLKRLAIAGTVAAVITSIALGVIFGPAVGILTATIFTGLGIGISMASLGFMLGECFKESGSSQ